MLLSIPVYFPLLLLWLAVASIGPGLFFVRHFRWKPLETLCASVAASLVFIYAGSMFIYAANLPTINSHRILAAICGAMTIASWKDLRRLIARRHIRRVLGAFGVLWCWALLQAADIRNFGGGDIYFDWIEHYKRPLFFLEHWDLNYRILGMYLLTARPPLMNLVCAHFMALYGNDFKTYQFIALFLNLLPALVCFLFVTSGANRKLGRRAATAAILFLLATNAAVMENVEFAWTKSFTAMPCLLAVWFYLRGWMKNDRGRLTAGFFFVAMACLSHYYACAWAAALGLHYLVAVWPKRRNKFGEILTIAGVCAALLATWFVWAIHTYGVSHTVRTNTTAWAIEDQSWTRIAVMGGNAVNVFVPYFFRSVPYGQFAQSDPPALIRDLIFCLDQTTIPFAWGIFGGLILVVHLRRLNLAPVVGRFWLMMFVVTTLLGIASTPELKAWGSLPLWGLPLIYFGICALASLLPRLSVPWQILGVCGCGIDFVLGILFQLHNEHAEYAVRPVMGQRLPGIVLGDHLPSQFAEQNIVAKHILGYHFIGDAFPSAWTNEVLLCLAFVGLLVYFTRRALSRREEPARLELHAA